VHVACHGAWRSDSAGKWARSAFLIARPAQLAAPVGCKPFQVVTNTVRSVSELKEWLGVIAAVLVALGSCGAGAARAATIIEDWADVKAPPPPVLKPASLDAASTALIVMDIASRCLIQYVS